MRTSDFDFELPPELIASHPLERRDSSRMLVVSVPLAQGQFPSCGGAPVLSCAAGWSLNNKSATYFNLPFNPKLAQRARELRTAGSLPEALLWKEIKNKKVNGLDFDRQKIIGNYIVDFFCPVTGVVIEIDDKATHDWKGEYDVKRDEYLKSLGLNVIRFSAKDVLKNPHEVFLYLKEILKDHPAAHNGAGTPPQEGNLVMCQLEDRHIRDFLGYLKPGDVVVFNNSKVIPARFNATASDGKKYEITLHTNKSEIRNQKSEIVWLGLCKKFNKIKIGEILTLDDDTQIEIIDKDDDAGLTIRFLKKSEIINQQSEIFDILDRVGKMPLPPYMHRDEEDSDRERYQPVYAGPLGSMAAPTAGLHFTDDMLREIENRGAKIVNITLHVGAGTWMPVKSDDLSEHKMHSEWGCITADQADIINNATRVIAIGTTSLRLLESAANKSEIRNQKSEIVKPFCTTTDIFITPGYKFKVVDVLLTNFHLPKSTLLMLVSAFAGVSEIRAAYKHAIEQKYRFFSYGDCMLLFKKDQS